MKYNDIAIIGMSCAFPEAANIEEFHRNLSEGRDSVRKVPESRRKLHQADPEKNYIEAGYLEGIDMFDNRFFGISDYEAAAMCPEQRISLELAAKAIEDAGYSLSSFRGKNCAVLFGASDGQGYYQMIQNKSSTSAVGSVKSMITGKIGYYLDLTGPNIIYDTGCSSALVALHEACLKLMVKETDYALVGGIHIKSYLSEAQPQEYDILGLGSNDYRSHSFEASSSGVGLGEGGGCVILKRLEDAIRDKDPVYAVLKSGCVNGDGGRCSSATIPSVEGQREVIENSWKEIDINALTEVEAHGIGTQIGDSVEADSIMQCLKKLNSERETVYLSSVKSSIGHLVEAAGISSLIKVLTGFVFRQTYPIVNFKNPNPTIDFDSSSLKPIGKAVEWDRSAKRTVGVEAFGLSGANAHVVVENYVEERERDTAYCDSLIKISAKSEESFIRYRERILEFLAAHPDVNFKDIVCTLNTSRDDYRFRRLIHAGDIEEFTEAMEQVSPVRNAGKNQMIIFCLKTEKAEKTLDETALQLFPSLKKNSGILSDKDLDRKYRLYQLMKKMGITPDLQLIDKTSRVLTDNITAGLDIGKIGDPENTQINQDFGRIIDIVDEKSERQEVVVCYFGSDRTLKEHSWKNSVRVYNLSETRDLRRFVINYYNSGHDLSWKPVYDSDESYHRIHMPSYEFEKISHWVKISKKEEKATEAIKLFSVPEKEEFRSEPVSVVSVPESVGEIREENTELSDAEARIEAIWRNIFDFNDKIGYDEDFFELGGNSLLIQQISGEINRQFGIQFDIYEIYDNPTISELAEKIIHFVKEGA